MLEMEKVIDEYDPLIVPDSIITEIVLSGSLKTMKDISVEITTARIFSVFIFAKLTVSQNASVILLNTGMR